MKHLTFYLYYDKLKEVLDYGIMQFLHWKRVKTEIESKRRRMMQQSKWECFLIKYRGSPRVKMVDLEAGGLRRRSLLKEGISSREGVYEFELFRRDCCVTEQKDLDRKLERELLVQVLYGLDSRRDRLSTKRKASELRRWLLIFKLVGSKYGDYDWLNDRKIAELVFGTLGLMRKELMFEYGFVL